MLRTHEIHFCLADFEESLNQALHVIFFNSSTALCGKKCCFLLFLGGCTDSKEKKGREEEKREYVA